MSAPADRQRQHRWPLAGSAPAAELVAWAILGLALAVGVTLRLRMLLLGRSLWLDPAMLALNLVERGPAELFGRLDLGQAAPVGFLLLTKLAGAAGGYSELSMIAVPFAFGVAALALFLPLTVDVLGRRAAPLAFVPFATCSTAVYYSGELKQYSADLFVAVAVLFVAHRAARSGLAGRWVAGWAVAGVAGVWLSHAAGLLIAGSGLGLAVLAWRWPERRGLRRLAVAGGVVLVHGLLLFFLQVRPSVSGALIAYHREAFAPLWPPAGETLRWWWRALAGYVRFPLGLGDRVVLPLAALAGGALAATFTPRHRPLALVALPPIAALVLASALGLYPIASGEHEVHARFLLFTLPIAFLLIGVGIEALTRRLPWPGVAAVVLGVLLVLPSFARILAWPEPMRQEMRPLVARLEREIAPGDRVYVYYAAVPAFRFYIRGRPIPFVAGSPPAEPSVELPRQVDRAGGDRRLWVVVAHDYRNAAGILRRHLRSRGYAIEQTRFPGALLLRADPAPSTNPR